MRKLIVKLIYFLFRKSINKYKNKLFGEEIYYKLIIFDDLNKSINFLYYDEYKKISNLGAFLYSNINHSLLVEMQIFVNQINNNISFYEIHPISFFPLFKKIERFDFITKIVIFK